MVENTYAKTIRATWIVTAASLVSFLLGLALRMLDVEQWWYFVLTLPVLLACLIAQTVFYPVGRIEQHQLQRLLEGGTFAHWTYRKDECVRFAALEWTRTMRKAVRLGLTTTLSMTLVGAFVAWLDARLSVEDRVLFGAALGLLLGTLVGLVFCAIGWIERHACLTGPAEAYVGIDGVFQYGRFVSWSLPWLRLAAVELQTGDPSVLHFEIKGKSGGVQELRVAVPAGRGTEAKRILARFPGVSKLEK